MKEHKTTAANLGFDEDNLEKTIPTMPPRDSKQLIFESGDGISCNEIRLGELRNKFLPFNISVMYDYKVQSELSMNILSKNEWQRRSQEGQLGTSQVLSEISVSAFTSSIADSTFALYAATKSSTVLNISE